MKVINILIHMLSYSNTGCPNVECKSEGSMGGFHWIVPVNLTLWTLGGFQSKTGKQVWWMSHVTFIGGGIRMADLAKFNH